MHRRPPLPLRPRRRRWRRGTHLHRNLGIYHCARHGGLRCCFQSRWSIPSPLCLQM
jgi:hypothetical protein